EQSTGFVRSGAGRDLGDCRRPTVEALSPALASGPWTLLRDGTPAGDGRITERPSVRRVSAFLPARRDGCVALGWQRGLRPAEPCVCQRNQPVVFRRLFQPALRRFPRGSRPHAAG